MGIKLPYNTLIQKQNNKNIATISNKGIIAQVYLESWTADVQVIGSTQTILKNVPISLAVGKHNIKVGDKCKLDIFDENNPSDMVIAYTYGRSGYKRSNSGVAGLSGSGAGSIVTIAHSLGDVPDIVSVTNPGYGLNGDTSGFYYLLSVDSVNLNFKEVGVAGGQNGYIWFAALVE